MSFGLPLLVLLSVLATERTVAQNFTQEQLRTIPNYPMTVEVLLDLKSVAEINEPLDQATLLFCEQAHYWRPEIMDLWSERNELECIVLPKTATPTAVTAQLYVLNFVGNPVSQECFPEQGSIAADVVACSDGRIVLGSLCKVKVVANFDVTNFPFDSQRLTTLYGHIILGNNFLNVSFVGTISHNHFKMGNQEWKIHGYNCSQHVLQFAGNPIYELYPMVQCDVHIERNPWHYICQFCIPACMSTAMALVGVKASFMASGLRGPGFQIAVMSLMSLAVLLLAVSSELPPANTISKMHIFYFTLVGLLFVSPLLNWMIWYQRRQRQIATWWIKQIDLILNALLLVAIACLFAWMSFKQ